MRWLRRRSALPARPPALSGEYLVPDDALEGELSPLSASDEAVLALTAATVRLAERVEQLQEELDESRRRNQQLAREVARLSIDLRAELARVADAPRVARAR